MNLDTMSLNELGDLNSRIAQAIWKRKQEAKEATRLDVLKIINRAGFTLSDVLPDLVRTSKRRVKRAGNGTLHCNPADPSQTWNGRGRPPKWFKKP